MYFFYYYLNKNEEKKKTCIQWRLLKFFFLFKYRVKIQRKRDNNTVFFGEILLLVFFWFNFYSKHV